MENNNQQQTYIGITLGPIDRIMSFTRSTKSLWAASYLMSFIGKQLVTELFCKEKREFIKPQLVSELWDLKDGVGRFPDQYIFRSKPGDWEYLLQKREEVLNQIAVQISLTLPPTDAAAIATYLKQTLKIYLLEMECTAEKALETCQNQLAVMECQDIYPDTETRNYLAEYFESIAKDTRLLNDAFGSNNKSYNRLFPTILERAGAVRDKVLEMSSLDNDVKIAMIPPHYKYIAFVSADGDNIGKALKALGTTVSNKMLAYNKKIVDLVEKRHGQVIYAGGDDLVFFAPIVEIFDLIQDISNAFNDSFATEDVQDGLKKHNLPIPTISFGVSISYHKHPMAEALQKAGELLEEAKKAGKDRILWNMRKHSGQSVVSTMIKSQLPQAVHLIKVCSGASDLFLHSVGHYLLANKEIIAHLLGDSTTAASRLENYMLSTFQDEGHENFQDKLALIRTYLLDESNAHENKVEVVERMAALLRYIELIIHKPQKGGSK